MRVKQVPRPGQIVSVDSAGTPRHAGVSARLHVSRPVEAVGSLDPTVAEWWLLTGWWLGADGERIRLCTVTVRASSVRVDSAPPVMFSRNP